MIEEWRKIDGYGGRYGVSNFGNIRNNDSKKILSQNLQKKSNLVYVSTRYKNRSITIPVKSSVYKKFSKIRYNNRIYNIVNIDKNIWNNHFDNLKLEKIIPLNRYKMFDDYVIGYIKEKEFFIDIEDYEKIKNMCWHIHDGGYAMSSVNNGNKIYNVYLHRFILDCDNKIVDHINRNKMDCRKSNLRFVTTQENNMNQSRCNRNKSGFIGVYKSIYKTKNKVETEHWRAVLKYNGKSFSKLFKKKEDAIKWRLQKELEYFGKDFAPQRHLFEQYKIK